MSEGTIRIKAVGVYESVLADLNRAEKAIARTRFNLNTRQVTEPLGRIARNASEFEKSLAASNARVIAFGASVGIISGMQRAFASLARETINVEKALADIQVVLNTSNLADFSKKLFQAAKDTGQSFDIAADAALEFSRQGLGAVKTLEAVKAALILVRLSGIDATKAVEGLTTVINGFQKETLNYKKIVDTLAATDAAFAVSSKDLVEAFSRVGSAAEDAGLNFNQLVAIVTSARQITGRSGAVIGNSLKTIFTRLQRTDTLDALEGLGIAARDANGNFRDAVSVLSDLAKRYDTLSDAQRAYAAELVGGVFQINILKATLGDLGKEFSVYKQALDTATQSTDAAIRRNALLNQTLAAGLNSLKTSLVELAANLGKAGLDAPIKRLIQAGQGLADFFNESLGEESGKNLAQGLIKGLGNFLAGPGLAILGVVIVKLFALTSKFALDTTKSLVGIGSETAKIRNLEIQINEALSKQNTSYSEILSRTGSRAAAEREVLKIIQQQQFALNNSYGGAGASLFRGGLRYSQDRGFFNRPFFSSSRVRSGVRGAAEGLVPAIHRERTAVSQGVGGARPHAKPVVLNNFAFGRGKRGTVVANSDEYIVKNYAGSGGDAVFNQDMVRTYGVPAGARKINNFPHGFIPRSALRDFIEKNRQSINSFTYDHPEKGITDYNAAQLGRFVRHDEKVGAPPPRGYKSWREFDIANNILRMRVKKGDDFVRRAFKIDRITQLRAKGGTFDVAAKGLIPNMAFGGQIGGPHMSKALMLKSFIPGRQKIKTPGDLKNLENLHMTLFSMKAMRRLDPRQREALLSAARQIAPPSKFAFDSVYRASRQDSGKESTFALIKNQEEFRDYVRKITQKAGISNPEANRLFHISLANKTGSGFDSIGNIGIDDVNVNNLVPNFAGGSFNDTLKSLTREQLTSLRKALGLQAGYIGKSDTRGADLIASYNFGSAAKKQSILEAIKQIQSGATPNAINEAQKFNLKDVFGKIPIRFQEKELDAIIKKFSLGQFIKPGANKLRSVQTIYNRNLNETENPYFQAPAFRKFVLAAIFRAQKRQARSPKLLGGGFSPLSLGAGGGSLGGYSGSRGGGGGGFVPPSGDFNFYEDFDDEEARFLREIAKARLARIIGRRGRNFQNQFDLGGEFTGEKDMIDSFLKGKSFEDARKAFRRDNRGKEPSPIGINYPGQYGQNYRKRRRRDPITGNIVSGVVRDANGRILDNEGLLADRRLRPFRDVVNETTYGKTRGAYEFANKETDLEKGFRSNISGFTNAQLGSILKREVNNFERSSAIRDLRQRLFRGIKITARETAAQEEQIIQESAKKYGLDKQLNANKTPGQITDANLIRYQLRKNPEVAARLAAIPRIKVSGLSDIANVAKAAASGKDIKGSFITTVNEEIARNGGDLAKALDAATVQAQKFGATEKEIERIIHRNGTKFAGALLQQAQLAEEQKVLAKRAGVLTRRFFEREKLGQRFEELSLQDSLGNSLSAKDRKFLENRRTRDYIGQRFTRYAQSTGIDPASLPFAERLRLARRFKSEPEYQDFQYQHRLENLRANQGGTGGFFSRVLGGADVRRINQEIYAEEQALKGGASARQQRASSEKIASLRRDRRSIIGNRVQSAGLVGSIGLSLAAGVAEEKSPGGILSGALSGAALGTTGFIAHPIVGVITTLGGAVFGAVKAMNDKLKPSIEALAAAAQKQAAGIQEVSDAFTGYLQAFTSLEEGGKSGLKPLDAYYLEQTRAAQLKTISVKNPELATRIGNATNSQDLIKIFAEFNEQSALLNRRAVAGQLTASAFAKISDKDSAYAITGSRYTRSTDIPITRREDVVTRTGLKLTDTSRENFTFAAQELTLANQFQTDEGLKRLKNLQGKGPQDILTEFFGKDYRLSEDYTKLETEGEKLTELLRIINEVATQANIEWKRSKEKFEQVEKDWRRIADIAKNIENISFERFFSSLQRFNNSLLGINKQRNTLEARKEGLGPGLGAALAGQLDLNEIYANQDKALADATKGGFNELREYFQKSVAGSEELTVLEQSIQQGKSFEETVEAIRKALEGADETGKTELERQFNAYKNQTAEIKEGFRFQAELLKENTRATIEAARNSALRGFVGGFSPLDALLEQRKNPNFYSDLVGKATQLPALTRRNNLGRGNFDSLVDEAVGLRDQNRLFKGLGIEGSSRQLNRFQQVNTKIGQNYITSVFGDQLRGLGVNPNILRGGGGKTGFQRASDYLANNPNLNPEARDVIGNFLKAYPQAAKAGQLLASDQGVSAEARSIIDQISGGKTLSDLYNLFAPKTEAIIEPVKGADVAAKLSGLNTFTSGFGTKFEGGVTSFDRDTQTFGFTDSKTGELKEAGFNQLSVQSQNQILERLGYYKDPNRPTIQGFLKNYGNEKTERSSNFVDLARRQNGLEGTFGIKYENAASLLAGLDPEAKKASIVPAIEKLDASTIRMEEAINRLIDNLTNITDGAKEIVKGEVSKEISVAVSSDGILSPEEARAIIAKIEELSAAAQQTQNALEDLRRKSENAIALPPRESIFQPYR